MGRHCALPAARRPGNPSVIPPNACVLSAAGGQASMAHDRIGRRQPSVRAAAGQQRIGPVLAGASWPSVTAAGRRSNSVRLVMSILVTFTALVLGLLTSSVKTNFDEYGDRLRRPMASALSNSTSACANMAMRPTPSAHAAAQLSGGRDRRYLARRDQTEPGQYPVNPIHARRPRRRGRRGIGRAACRA